MSTLRSSIRLRPDVAEALANKRPVVALESTLIAHGLPRPENLALARELESIVRAEGGVPATVGVLEGQPVVGLSEAEIERIATGAEVPKLSARDLAPAAAAGSDGATTVASTALLANRAGIRVFATGGLGGVHREARQTYDESADLAALSRTPIGVVCAGVKSILDVGATLERLETLSVTVIGYRTRRFPGFYITDSGFSVDWSVESPEAAASVLNRGLHDGAVIIANPLPVEDQLDPDLHQRVLEAGLRALADQDIRGKAITPFLLDYFRVHTAGASVAVNLNLIRANARLAAHIARALKP
ncbi:MAG TPA: pseudouridine-5'-phosphate glycosidase [Chloroflexota bacterium]|nr:pseudouridine-5'-phosphate glycosidase [Chloroflexota bacterium]